MSLAPTVVVAAPVRTAIGAPGGALRDVAATDLGARVIAAAVHRARLDPGDIQTVVMGNVVQAGNRMNPARQTAIHAGLPVSTTAMTVNRVCGSGAQAIVSAAQEIQLGHVQAAVAGGMENMNQAPFLVARGRWGYRMGHGQLYDSVLRDGLNDAYSDAPLGWHTEDLVARYAISRAEQDQWAVRSQERFAAAQAAGRFAAEIVPVEVAGPRPAIVFDRDEHNSPGTTSDALARLKPAFRPEGTITAGNAAGLNDGAAAMILAEAAWADARGVHSLARLVSYGISGVEPGMFGLGNVPAINQALERAGWTLGSLQRIEINESFAAVPIVVIRELGVPEQIVNVEGGAVAHGHPIGATGAILVARLIHSMRRDGLTRGMVSLCVGGGQGIALAFEILP